MAGLCWPGGVCVKISKDLLGLTVSKLFNTPTFVNPLRPRTWRRVYALIA